MPTFSSTEPFIVYVFNLIKFVMFSFLFVYIVLHELLGQNNTSNRIEGVRSMVTGMDFLSLNCKVRVKTEFAWLIHFASSSIR